MREFLSQGGYGFYVWSSYGISALALVGLAVWTLTGWRRAKTRLKALAPGDGEAP